MSPFLICRCFTSNGICILIFVTAILSNLTCVAPESQSSDPLTSYQLHCNLLDRDFHTPSLVCSRSPFLLTTSESWCVSSGERGSNFLQVSAISAKFYSPRPELHGKLTELSKKLAFSVPAQGYKSLEIVQAYLLLALWGTGPVERYEQDRTWMLLGMAIR